MTGALDTISKSSGGRRRPGGTWPPAARLPKAVFASRFSNGVPYLGGRASSYQHPGTGEVVDNCQHVLLGCCTNLIEFYQRIGVEDKIRWYERDDFSRARGARLGD